MNTPRHKARVARVLSYGKRNGTKWRRFNGCVLACGILLLVSVAFFQLRHVLGSNHPSSDLGEESERINANFTNDGKSWKGKLWRGGAGEEIGQGMERKKGSRESWSIHGIVGDQIEGVSSKSENGTAEEDESDRMEELENEMDMEDEDGDEFESFDGKVGDSDHARYSRGLVERKNGFGISLPQQKRELMAKGVQGVSKADDGIGVFSTDDEPLDTDTRDRVERMSTIEDVLMLKRVDSSAKKKGWGKIQDELFLQKEKDAQLSSDPLNPENNPLLQDPDSVSVGSSLTYNDRSFLKAFKWGGLTSGSLSVDDNVHLHIDSQKKPDVRLPDDNKEGTNDQSLDRGAGVHRELATEVRVLHEGRKMDQSEKHDPLKGESDLSESREIKREGSVETSSALPKRRELQRTGYKKGRNKVQQICTMCYTRGWAYYAGFRSKLTFSNFMEEFLFHENCSMRVFMAWMTPSWAFTVRHQRVLESLLYFHPTACVVVFADETVELELFEGFVEEGYRIATVMPALEELLHDTPLDVFATILPRWRQVDLFYIHYTELLRLGALYKYGGIYLDFDMIVVNPLTHLNNTVGSEQLEDGQLRPNGAIMVFERFSPFLNRSMAEFTATYDETLKDWNGAALLDRVMQASSEDADAMLASADKPHVKPAISFFPLSSESIRRYFTAPQEDDVVAEEMALLDKIVSESYTVHLWNPLTYNIIPDPGSLIEKLMDRHCIHCTDIL